MQSITVNHRDGSAVDSVILAGSQFNHRDGSAVDSVILAGSISCRLIKASPWGEDVSEAD